MQSLSDAHEHSVHYLQCVHELRAIDQGPPPPSHHCGTSLSAKDRWCTPVPTGCTAQRQTTGPRGRVTHELDLSTTRRPACKRPAMPISVKPQHKESCAPAQNSMLQVVGRDALHAVPHTSETHSGPGCSPLDASSQRTIQPCRDLPCAETTAHNERSVRSAAVKPQHARVPLESPLCIHHAHDVCAQSKFASPLPRGCEDCSEDGAAIPGRVQPNAWAIDGGLRCSAATAHGRSTHTQHSHPLPTLQVRLRHTKPGMCPVCSLSTLQTWRQPTADHGCSCLA